MAGESVRLLDPQVLSAGDTMNPERVYDGGGYKNLEIHTRILKAGSGGNIKLQHAAVNEPGAFIDLATATWAANGNGSYVSISNFLRYVRWICDGAVAGGPIAVIDLVAKE